MLALAIWATRSRGSNLDRGDLAVASALSIVDEIYPTPPSAASSGLHALFYFGARAAHGLHARIASNTDGCMRRRHVPLVAGGSLWLSSAA